MIHLNDLANPLLVGGVRGIIFDCDGVLIDSLPANTFFYNSFKENFGLQPMTPEEEAYVHAHHVWESLAHILPPEHYQAARERKYTYDYREVLPHIRIQDGLREFLQWARAAGFRMGIATSRTDTMDMVLSHLGLEEFFFPVITSFKVRNPKPHPESIYAVLDAWRLPLDEVVFIGDSGVDERTAMNAGARFWSFGDPSLFAELFIPDFWTLRNRMHAAYQEGFLWP